jgi:drug/metabolite transporter (DMT)-like permease
VAPFFYTGALWAVISSGLVFGTLPNALGFAGIALIVISGVGVLLLSENRRRDPPGAAEGRRVI